MATHHCVVFVELAWNQLRKAVSCEATAIIAVGSEPRHVVALVQVEAVVRASD